MKNLFSRRHVGFLLLAALNLLLAQGSFATDPAGGAYGGGDTPTGLAGSLGGTISTGAGSFDPYERNASRSVTDMVVPGAVVPFTYTRLWNSRSGWSDNWGWGIDVNEITGDLPPGSDPNDYFLGYHIGYPDGRKVTFNKPSVPAHAPQGGPGTYTHADGIFDKFIIQASGVGQLFLADGSVVNFNMPSNSATSIVDRYMRTVTFAQDGTGRTITEPGGRWIHIGLPSGSGTNHQVTTITSSLGQTVTYTMDYAVSGLYPYQPPNPPTPPGDPNGPTILTSLGSVTYNDVLDPATNQPIQANYVYKQVKPPPRDSNPSTPDP